MAVTSLAEHRNPSEDANRDAEWRRVVQDRRMGHNRRLSATELDQRLNQLRFGAKPDVRGIARLLAESEWTQEELAARLKKSQPWITCQVRFGEFLNFITNVIIPQKQASEEIITNVIKISEGRFRTLYNQTDKDESGEARFAEVLHLLEEEQGKPSRALADRLMARFADSKWHALDSIATRLDVSQADITATLKLLPKPPYDAKVETKQVGLRPHHRIFRADRTIRYSELIEKLGPVIEELIDQGKRNMATMDVGTVAHCAAILKRQFDDWGQ